MKIATPAQKAKRDLCDAMLAVIRREFYPTPADSKKFFRDRAFLMRAITQPAAYLNRRGAMLPASSYRRILETVIGTIKAKGDVAKIGYFPRYLLTCVQSHMEHHGERYYYTAKSFEGRSISARQVSDVVGEALKTLPRGGGSDQTVPILAKVHEVLTARGRIRKGKTADSELELPGLCNGVAKRSK